jgi:allantoicase
MTQPLHPQDRAPGTAWIVGLVGLRGGLDSVEIDCAEDRTQSPRSFSQQCSKYTSCDTAPHGILGGSIHAQTDLPHRHTS